MLNRKTAEKKIAENARTTGNICYETKTYHYCHKGEKVYAIRKEYLDTTAALDPENWVEIK